MRRFAWLILATITLIAGCGQNPAPPAEKAELPDLTAPQDPSVAYISIVGDWLTSGSKYGGLGANGWPAIAATRFQSQGVNLKESVGAKAGSGYVQHQWDGNVPFIDQVHRVVGSTNRVVVLFGSKDDQTVPPDQLSTAVQRTLTAAKTAAPEAKLLVIGPAVLRPNPAPEVLQVRDVIKAQSEALGVTFVDPIAEGWFFNHPELVSPDNGDAINDAGHVYLADKITPLIAQQLKATAKAPA